MGARYIEHSCATRVDPSGQPSLLAIGVTDTCPCDCFDHCRCSKVLGLQTGHLIVLKDTKHPGIPTSVRNRAKAQASASTLNSSMHVGFRIFSHFQM
eukprot:3551813-Pyramimonas_sp.AAC.1